MVVFIDLSQENHRFFIPRFLADFILAYFFVFIG